MDTKESLEKQIEELCMYNGFLDGLRMHVFKSDKFDEIYQVLEKYHEAVKGHEQINRQTAGFLDTVHVLITSSLLYHQWEDKHSKIHYQLMEAADKILDVTTKIYFVD